MPDSTDAYFTSMSCGAVVQIGVSAAFLAIGVQYKDECCDQPLANWNIAAGAIGCAVGLITLAALSVSRKKAKEHQPELPEEMEKGPDGRDLTEAQREAIRKIMVEHERNKARKDAMFDGPVGKLYAFVQSCQTCYIVIMVIVGAAFVWSTHPNDLCLISNPHGCAPFLWNWTQGWVIVYFVFTGLLCCLGCCAICAVAGMRASGTEGQEPDSSV